jgi:uncharacterized protein YkwD
MLVPRLRSSIVVAVAATALIAPTAHASSTTHADRTAAPPVLRTRMLGFVNHVRELHNLPPLQINTRLSNEALHHSVRMAIDGELSHTSNLADLIRSEGGTVFGENLGKGRGLRGIRNAWLRRADTRSILLDPRFVHVGLGVVHVDGFYWVTFQAFN